METTTGYAIEVKLQGRSIEELIGEAQAFISALEARATAATIAATSPAPLGKKKTAKTKTTETPEPQTIEAAFDTPTFEDVVEETAKTEKPTKAKKIEAKDVNAAAVAHAKKFGRAKTLAILEKIGVASVLELEPDQYASVIKALKV